MSSASPPDAAEPYALKEWDAQVQALVSGRTAVILRKGGIMETHEGFSVEHRAFFLYPTFLHQNPREVRADFAPLLRADPAPGTVTLPALARVRDVWRIDALERALALEDLQVLTAQAIERRFRYRDRPVLHALLLDVTRLHEGAVLEETPEMLGCVSWVPLRDAPSTAGERVLAPPRLGALHETLRARLE